MYIPGYFEFGLRTRILAGRHAIDRLQVFLDRARSACPMIVTDAGVVAAGLIDLIESTAKLPASRVIADGVPSDSDVDVVNQLVATYRQKGCDSIIAVGGGSVIDTAKAINILVSENSDDLMQFCGGNRLQRRLRPLVVIPTTAGTGSEVTGVAVIADHRRQRKMLFASAFLCPDMVVIDSRMTLSLPPFLTAATGIDALVHAVEAYIDLAKNPFSDQAAWTAVELISQHLLTGVHQPDNPDTRYALATAATLAGVAFSNSTVGVVHAIGHSVGAVCGVHHGQCMGIGLPVGLEYNMRKCGENIGRLLLPLAGADVYVATPRAQRAAATVACIRELNRQLREATGERYACRFKDVKDRQGQPMVPREKWPDIADTTLGDGTLFYAPEDMNYDDAMTFIEAAWQGSSLSAGTENRKGAHVYN